ncbi:MAG: PcfJ domain-containing protein [Candidatus Thorarchaeota archaeon]|jgi:hypothetical protein
MADAKSRYRFKEFKNGFRIEGEDRRPVDISISPEGMSFDVSTSFKIKNHWTHEVEALEQAYTRSYGIPHLYMLVDRIANDLMLGWQPPEGKAHGKIANVGWDVRTWAVTQTKKALASRIKEQWLRLKERMNPTVVAVQNRIFSVALKVPEYMHTDKNFYEDKFIIQDIMNYRAAAAVAAKLEEAMGIYFDFNSRPNQPWTMLDNWMGMYAPNGVAYPALRKTLMNLPGNFPPGPLQAIRHTILPEAIKERQRLLAMTVIGQEADYAGDRIDRFIPVVLRSNEDDFSEMISVVASQNIDWPEGPRTFKRFRRSFSMVMDYPAEFGPIDIMGLTRRSMEYHNNETVRRQLEQRQRAMEGLEPDTLTAVPPIPLPTDDKLIFLDTVERVADEGANMGHCVGGYAGRAVEGHCYLFHVEYDGEEATVEVDQFGTVRQGSGPKNTRNKAVDYGKKALTKWGGRIEAEPLKPTMKVARHAALPQAAD